MKLGLKRRGKVTSVAQAPVDLRRILSQKLGQKTFSPEALSFFALVQTSVVVDKAIHPAAQGDAKFSSEQGNIVSAHLNKSLG